MKAKSYGLADLSLLKKNLDQQTKLAKQQRAEQKIIEQHQRTLHAEFSQAVQHVTPIKSKNTFIHPPRKIKLPEVKRAIPATQKIKDNLSDGFDAAHLRDDELNIYLRQGIPEALLKKLQKGFWSIDLRLDLHGKTSEEARIATSAFLYQARQIDARVVSIIHGQGYGSASGQAVLKQHVRNWLVQNNDVLAFCAAPAAAGGHGAVLILLHKKDKP